VLDRAARGGCSKFYLGAGLTAHNGDHCTATITRLTSFASLHNLTIMSGAGNRSSDHLHRAFESALFINTHRDLSHYEQEIVARIAGCLNGGNLFLAHPFQCLADLNVQLSSELRAELIHSEPALQVLSLTAYNALKASTKPELIQVRVKGLFRKRKP